MGAFSAEKQQAIPRAEHPRPQWMRESWINLNGEWQFEIDNARSGEERGLHREGASLSQVITVPFCPESRLSGLAHTDFMRGVWYKRTITLPKHNGVTRLHFGAVDYAAKVFVNGMAVGTHKGGYSPFWVDVSEALRDGENEITVFAQDDTTDPLIPSGKQSTSFASQGCFYTRTTGIWQTVWLEQLPPVFVESVSYTTNIYDGSVTVEVALHGEGAFSCDILFDGRPMGHYEVGYATERLTFTVPLAEVHLWELGQGFLYDTVFRFGEDTVYGYFGLREVRLDGKRFLLNGRPVFQRLILDQGFYPDGIYTAPSDEALSEDIRLSMALGFNGARLHEKVFEERYLYHADRMGYMVWGEYPDWGLDHSRSDSIYPILPEWTAVVMRDRNHPSVIGWCPRNETWDQGYRKQNDDAVAMLYEVTKQLDPTRPCIDASGNFHVNTDIFDVHDYDQDPETVKKRYDRLATEGVLEDRFAERQTYRGEAVMVSEYGGIRFAAGVNDKTLRSSWGYGDDVADTEDFIRRFRGLTDALLDNPALCGFCYTQLTDVEQEQNGLYTYERKPKFDAAVLRAIVSRKAAMEG